MKKAQAITDKAFARILDFIVPGMTEREVQMQLDRYMFEEGAQGLALIPSLRRVLMGLLLMLFLAIFRFCKVMLS